MKQRFIWTVTLLLVALAMVLASCGSATTPTQAPGSTTPATPAAPSTSTPRQGRGTNGTLAKIDGNTLTLTTTQGQVMVNVSSATTFQKTTSGTLSDLQDGQSLIVMGTPDTNGNITATSISIRPQGQGVPPTPPAGATPRTDRTATTPDNGSNPRSQGDGVGRGAFGTLAKIDGNTLTLTTAQGQVTVNVGSDTTVQMTTTGTLSDLHEGESLTVIGSSNSSTGAADISAVSIMIRPQSQGIPPTSSPGT